MTTFSTSPRPFQHDEPRVQSPGQLEDLSSLQRTQISHIDERHPRNSLPHNRIDTASRVFQRSETLPDSISTHGPTMISPHDFVELVKNHLAQDLLLLDLRGQQPYCQSRIHDALNLCISTMLLKRPSFDVQKLLDTYSRPKDRAKFSEWSHTKFIVVYDATSMQLKDAASSVNTLKKFTNEGYKGATLIIRGGFNMFAKRFPEQVDNRSENDAHGPNAQKLSIEPPGTAPVAGGCVLPATQSAANPFFGNIRQNMDLIGGVGQLPVRIPSDLNHARLPTWLREIASENDSGKTIADRFLGIEKAEQQRMQKALSNHVTYGTPNQLSPEAVQIAGIEKGTKNRYKDMLPYDHSRVKLQNVPFGGCDYVNASHVNAQYSNRHYIASQAPVPDTFEDFWRVVWEQHARVIVMLTAESEGGHRKSHPYWLTGDYGPFKLKAIGESRQTLEKNSPNRSFTAPQNRDPRQRPGMNRRHTSSTAYTNDATNRTNSPTINAHISSPVVPTSPIDPTTHHIIVRTLVLSRTDRPFEPDRELTQLQYSSWPDFGAPAHPAHVLALVEHCRDAVGRYDYAEYDIDPDTPAYRGKRPIVVHCSAGCGRTGTFCTVDSCIDILQNTGQGRHVWPEDKDLIANTVAGLRSQRISMVQTLRQFVLCYEAVLEWYMHTDAYKPRTQPTEWGEPMVTSW